jgi:hypothetical protein
MKKVLYIVLGVFLTGWSQLPRISVLQGASPGITQQEHSAFIKGLEHGVASTGYFRMIFTDERNLLLQQAGENRIDVCLSKACHYHVGKYLNAQLVVGTRLSRQGKDSTYTAELYLYSIPQKELIEKKILNAHIDSLASLTQLGKEGARLLFGKGGPTALTVTTDSSKIPEHTWQWGTAVGAVLAAYAYFGTQNETLLGADRNQAPVPDSLRYPTKSPPLSGLRGFFASRAPLAKHRAMGNAGLATVQSGSAVAVNPAGIARITNQQIMMSRSPQIDNTQQLFFSYGASLAGNVSHTQAVRLEGDDLAREMTFYSGYAMDLSVLSPYFHGTLIGISFKGYMIEAGIQGQGTQRSTGYGKGLGFDLGLQWKLIKDFAFGLVIVDPYSQIWYYNTLSNYQYTENLPPLLKAGASAKALPALQLHADLQKGLYADQNDILSAGVQYTLFEILHLRGGLFRILDMPRFQTLTLGFGIDAQVSRFILQLNYAYEKGLGDAGFLQYEQIFTLHLQF